MENALARYVAGQRAAAERTLEEERGQAPHHKLELLARLMSSVDGCGFGAALSEGDATIRERWQKLRERLGKAP